jgi:hydrogenase maturation protease
MTSSSKNRSREHHAASSRFVHPSSSEAPVTGSNGNRPGSPASRITILGVGNILLSDEGVGVRVVEHLARNYTFDDRVRVLDGGVLGVRLMGIVGDTDILILVDAVCNRGEPGDLYRLADQQVPRRVLAKQSMHQMDLPEVLALCRAIDHDPKVVVIGVEPEDIATFNDRLTPVVAARVEALAAMVLGELDRLGVSYAPVDNSSR